MDADDFAEQVAGVAALADPIRRELFRHVVAQGDPVSRDEASERVGVPRHTAKFHLDRLVEEGLLDTEFKRLSGRQGPGAGRPTKLYRRSTRELSVTLPQRHYDLAAHLMASAIEASAADRTAALDALHRVAADAGRDLGDETRVAAGARPSRSKIVDAACTTLAAHGYAPRHQNDRVTLTNCPFHGLVRDHTDLVCGMNLALLEVMAERGTDGALTARLDPAEGRCCVTLSTVNNVPRQDT
ncbi:MAG: helix-turn-helix domain-containing protein [Sporichthyaceae bacterium]